MKNFTNKLKRFFKNPKVQKNLTAWAIMLPSLALFAFFVWVPIFQNVTAIQNAHIVPTSEFDAQNPYTTEGEIFDEYENPNL